MAEPSKSISSRVDDVLSDYMAPRVSAAFTPGPSSLFPLISAAHTDGPRQIVFLHGWDGGPEDGAGLAAALAAQGRTVFSTWLPCSPQPVRRLTNLLECSRAVFGLLKELPSPPVVVGHSFGAAAALTACGLFGLELSGLVSIASPAVPREHLDQYAARRKMDEELLAATIAQLEAQIGCTLDSLAVPNLPKPLPARGLIIHDELDRIIPFENANILQRAWPQASLLATRGLGHGRVLRADPVLQAVGSFIDGCLPPTAGFKGPGA